VNLKQNLQKRRENMKNDYNRNYLWKIKNPETQQYRFYLRPNGKFVEVNEDVFKVCV